MSSSSRTGDCSIKCVGVELEIGDKNASSDEILNLLIPTYVWYNLQLN